jgi:dihydroxyacetone kinase-like predicted kinase
MQSAVKELSLCQSGGFAEICNSVSKGALKGARGNSGVITSQILKGICNVLGKAEKEVDPKTFAKAMEQGTKVAYGAVSLPKEGTPHSYILIDGNTLYLKDLETGGIFDCIDL